MHIDEILRVSYPKGKALSEAVLPLLPGMPLMLTKNLNVHLGTNPFLLLWNNID